MAALFNENNKKIGRDGMRHSEAAQALPPEQSGGRKQMCSNVTATEKVLSWDIIRQQHSAATHEGLDASQCYDRMVHAPTGLAMIKYGCHAPAVKSMFTTLQHAAHRVTTAYGISKRTYGGNKRRLRGLPYLQSIGQGNGAGPAGFIFLSSNCIEIMRRKGYAALCVACISLIQLTMVCFMFVDDADFQTMAPTVDTPGEDLVPQAQEALDCWIGSLACTGGAINIDKSYWYLLDFKWCTDHWEYRSREDMPGILTAQDLTGKTIPLDRLEANEGEETLGIYLAPDGNMAQQITKLEGKAQTYAQHVLSKGPATKNDVWTSYTLTIRPTMSYCMPASTILEDEWNQLFSIINRAALPRAGFVRTFPHKVLYGPSLYQGLGTMHPWYEQELTHLHTFVDQVNRNTSCGFRFQATTEAMRLETGFPGAFTDVPYDLMQDCVTDTWIKTFWHSCHAFDISIQDTFGTFALSREGDCFLMPFLVAQGVPPHTLEILNECRLFLEAITLADIVSLSGASITEQALQGIKSLNSLQSYKWPRRPPSLPQHYWQIWRETLTRYLVKEGETQILKQPLGNWTVDPHLTWEWFYDPTTAHLYHRTEHTITPYARNRSSRLGTSQEYSPTHSQALILPQVELAQVASTPRNTITLSQTTSPVLVPAFTRPHIANPLNLQEAKMNQPVTDHWAVSKLRSKDEGKSIAEAIQAHQAIAVSDGSGSPTLLSSAFILTAKSARLAKTLHPVHGGNIVPSNASEMDSYRAELGGVMGVLVTLQILGELHGITEGSLVLGLDGDEARKAIFDYDLPKVDAPSYDLIRSIKSKLQSLPFTVTSRHIKGHQDKLAHRSQLDRWANLNIDMDTQAKAILAKAAQSTQAFPNQPLSHENLVITHAGLKLSRIDKQDLYNKIYGPKTQQYWAQRHSIPQDLIDTIDWDAQQQAINREPLGKRRWLAKHLCGQCGVGRVLLRRKHQAHDNCPRCGESDESVTHVVTCQALSAIVQWNDSCNTLESWLFNSNTQNDLISAILSRISTWRKDIAVEPVTGPKALRKAIAEQDKLGWENFMYGRVSTHITEYQHQHFRNTGRQNTGKAWVSKLINQLWLVVWQMWDHRNKINTGTTTAQERSELRSLQCAVKQEFHLGRTGLGPGDFHLVDDKHAVLDYPLPQLRSWHARILNARAAHTRTTLRLRNALRKSQTLMRSWLHQAK